MAWRTSSKFLKYKLSILKKKSRAIIYVTICHLNLTYTSTGYSPFTNKKMESLLSLYHLVTFWGSSVGKFPNWKIRLKKSLGFFLRAPFQVISHGFFQQVENFPRGKTNTKSQLSVQKNFTKDLQINKTPTGQWKKS